MRGDKFALAQCLQSLVLSLPPIKCVAAPCKKSIPPQATKTSPGSTRTRQSETNFHHAKAGALGGSSGRMREVWREKGPLPKGGLLLPPRSCYALCRGAIRRERPAVVPHPRPPTGRDSRTLQKKSLPPETKNLAEPDFIPTYRKPHRETQRNAYPDMHCE